MFAFFKDVDLVNIWKLKTDQKMKKQVANSTNTILMLKSNWSNVENLIDDQFFFSIIPKSGQIKKIGNIEHEQSKMETGLQCECFRFPSKAEWFCC